MLKLFQVDIERSLRYHFILKSVWISYRFNEVSIKIRFSKRTLNIMMHLNDAVTKFLQFRSFEFRNCGIHIEYFVSKMSILASLLELNAK